MKLVSGLNFEDGDESNSGFVPLMQGMMKSILSKDILYPSLKDIVSKVNDIRYCFSQRF